MPTPISWDVYARDRASRTFTTVGGAASKSSGLVGKFGTALAGALTGAAIYHGATRLVGALGDLAQGAADDEAAARRMALQFRNSADATDAQTAAVEQWIEAQGEAIGITDDELRPALTRLVTATEDVGEAQDLTALAMDVAAGKQKSLLSVSEALAKGEDGQTTALKRLGVQTEDAAGKALTFEQITANLAKTFKGQASESADTASGAYKRLQTRFSELGEDVGYKLLPHLLEVGDWILDEGIPAGEDLAHQIGDELGPAVRDLGDWISENKDEMAEFGGQVRDTVLPPLKALVGIAGDAAGVLGNLPGPVQSFGIQAAIASRIVPGLNTSLLNARGAVFSYTGAVDAAEKRTAALRSTARTAAGVGGLMLIAHGAQQSSDKLGILEMAAGGALAGGVGGPWGALIGGGIGAAMGILSRQTGRAGDSASSAAPKWEGLADTLDDVSGSTTAATRAFVDDKLVRADVLPLLAAEGINRRTAINAILGEKSARQQVNAVIREQSAAYEQTAAKIEELSKKRDELATTNSMDEHATRAQMEQAEAIQKEIDGLKELNGTRKRSIDSIRSGIGAVREETRAQRERAQATADYSGKLKGVPKDVKSLIIAQGLEPTTRGVAELIAKYDHKLDKRAIKSIVSASGVPATMAEVQRLIDKLNAIPTRITTHINQVGNHASINNAGGRINAGYGSDAQDRASLVAGFGGMQSSVFGMSGGDQGPLSVDSILAFGDAEKRKAEKALADMAKLRLMGLSEALIKQFASQGAAGMEVLGTLASGANTAQIGLLNAQNAATMSAYGGLGEEAAGSVFGSSGGYDPSGAGLPFGHGGKGGGRGQNRGLSREDIKEAMRDALLEVDTVGRLELGSDGLVAALKRERRRRGPLGFD